MASHSLDGYVNATRLCKEAGKEWKNYYATAQTKRYLNSLLVELGDSVPLFVSNTTGLNETRGTWVHPLLVEHLRNWTLSNPPRESNGFVYLVTCPFYSAVKIGSWRAAVPTLRMRYKTLLGRDLWIAYVSVEDAFGAEAHMHRCFAAERMDGEMFKKDKIKDYVRELQTLGDLSVDERECTELL